MVARAGRSREWKVPPIKEVCVLARYPGLAAAAAALILAALPAAASADEAATVCNEA